MRAELNELLNALPPGASVTLTFPVPPSTVGTLLRKNLKVSVGNGNGFIDHPGGSLELEAPTPARKVRGPYRRRHQLDPHVDSIPRATRKKAVRGRLCLECEHRSGTKATVCKFCHHPFPPVVPRLRS